MIWNTALPGVKMSDDRDSERKTHPTKKKPFKAEYGMEGRIDERARNRSATCRCSA